MIYTLGDRRVQLRGSGHYIAPSAVVVGSVILEQQVSVWFNVVIRGDNEDIVLGPRCNIQDGSVLHTDEGVPLSVGASVSEPFPSWPLPFAPQQNSAGTPSASSAAAQLWAPPAA